MKPRHAAALALVGWYLIFPPVKPAWIDPTDSRFKPDQLDSKAPVHEWWIADWACNLQERTAGPQIIRHQWWVADWRVHVSSTTSIEICDVFRTSDECRAAISSMKLRQGDDWTGKAQCINSEDQRLNGYPLKFVGEPE